MFYYLYRPRVYRPWFWLNAGYKGHPQDSESPSSENADTSDYGEKRRRRCGVWWVQPCCCLWLLLAAALAFGLVGGLVVLPAIGESRNNIVVIVVVIVMSARTLHKDGIYHRHVIAFTSASPPWSGVTPPWWQTG